ncbi:MAG: M64 family metallo-endopeptidase [Bacteroidetes bacterium]|nr:M64 family metallo-endopeptidase [Bacteroidota bacterium]
MKNAYPVLMMLSLFWLGPLSAQNNFDQYFKDQTLRIDYYHSGNAQSESVVIDRIFQYGIWAGSLVNLVDNLNYGAYYHKVYDSQTKQLIYSRGFDSYFKEYQTSTPASEGQVKTFHESAILPLPKSSIIFALEKRNKEGHLNEIFQIQIDPSDAGIIKNEGIDPQVKVFTSLNNGDPHIKADIAIIGEGYTAEQEDKFKADLNRFTEVFFKAEPCKSYKDHFNIYGVFKPSAQSGVDEPRAGIYKNTAVSASFNALGSERYLLTEDNRSLRNIASRAPYDALYIMVNHTRYGGGGIYNFYCTYTSDNINSEYLMVHEFGHSFFGLADEYYTSSTAYNDFYPPGYEPSEPNITALGDPKNVKWKHLVAKGIEMPTPWGKAAYDEKDYAWQKIRTRMNDNIAKLQMTGALKATIIKAKQEYDTKSIQRDKEVQEYLENSIYAGKVGAFEGAGYASTGLFRPYINCIMFTRTDYFCPVCQEAMDGIIDWYSK